jgi:hypothetical protein
MITVQADTRGLEKAMFDFAMTSRKLLGDVVKQQTGILVGHIIALTPPGGKGGDSMNDAGVISLAAKKRGEASIAADISKLFPTSKLPHDQLASMVAGGFEFRTGKGHKDTVREVAESSEDLRRIHQFARNPRSGRTRKMKGIGMAITRAPILKRYIRQEIAKVGKLNAGWLAAASALKTSKRATPAWITRHGNRPGGAEIKDVGPKVGIRIYNSQTWFPASMDARVRLAIQRRERGIYVAMEAILKKRAQAAERKMGR